MKPRQDITTPFALASKPSAAFSITSSASATSVGSTRSGGSRLLFGEVDTSSARSIDGCASVCSFVHCESSTFLRFWLDDEARKRLISYLPKSDLANLRLTCHDFGVRAAPTLFRNLTITFTSSTFSKPARLAALDRVGFHVKTLEFRAPHSSATFLPPLVDPETGSELSFTYTPQFEPCTVNNPKYGDLGTTEILTRQWPTLFHAATNVPAFVKAFSSLINLKHLKLSCPGYEHTQEYRRSTVDFALISLRIAVERNRLNALDTLTLASMHPGAFTYLSPLLGYGACPRSSVAWSRIKHLDIEAERLPPSSAGNGTDQMKLVQAYLRNFQHNVTNFKFSWKGGKGPFPIRRPPENPAQKVHPLHRPEALSGGQASKFCKKMPALHFRALDRLQLENIQLPATDFSDFLELHKQTIGEVDIKEIELEQGSWDDAFAPIDKLRKLRKHHTSSIDAEIPIMFSPSTGQAHSSPTQRMHKTHREGKGKRRARPSIHDAARHKGGGPSAAQKVREGLLGCEGQLKKVLRGSVFQWL